MKLLLDTNALLFWSHGSPRLGPNAAKTIQFADTLLVSIASFWEIAIKTGLGKLDTDVDALHQGLVPNGARLLPVHIEHCRALRDLPHHHRDPFDRMLIAQCLCETTTLVSSDMRLMTYNIDFLDAGQ